MAGYTRGGCSAPPRAKKKKGKLQMTRNAKVEPMKWKEFKEEWKKLDKNRQFEIVAIICGSLVSAAMMILGCRQMGEYLDLIPSDHRYAIGGAFIFSAGLFVLWYSSWRYDRSRFARIEDRIEKLEGSDE